MQRIQRRSVVAGLSCLCAFLTACPPPPVPTLETTPVGTIIGQTYVEEGGARVSIGGATVEVYGTSSRRTSEVGKNFVLHAIPVGEHVVNINHPGLGRSLRINTSVGSPFETVTLLEADTTLKQAATLTGTVTASGSAAGTLVYLVGGDGQTASTDAEGDFTLGGLPPSDVEIAFWRSEHDLVIVSIALVEGANALDEVVALSQSAEDNLSLSGTVQLEGLVDLRGISVLLNGGEQVAATDEAGTYSFAGLSPGLYSVRAERSGFLSVELPQIALTSSGSVHGLVDMFLAPGSDEPVREGSFNVAITSPPSNETFEETEPLLFSAQVNHDGEQIAGQSVSWLRRLEGTDAVEPLCGACTGNPVTVTDLPQGRWLVVAEAQAADGETSRSPEILVIVEEVNLDLSILAPVVGSTVKAQVPVLFAVNIDVRDDIVIPSENIVWSEGACGDGGLPFAETGESVVASLSSASIGLATLSVDVTLPGGLGADCVDTQFFVEPLVVAEANPAFAGVVGDPTVGTAADGRTRFTVVAGQPAEIRAEVLDGSVSWVTDTALAVSGPVFNLGALPAGTHDLTLTVTDAGGNAEDTAYEIIVEPFAGFDVVITAPSLGNTYYAADGVPFGLAPISHPFQNAFAQSDITWFDANNIAVAAGTGGAVFGLALGAGSLRVEAVDVAGNVATALTQYVADDVTFTASFNSPTPSTTLQPADALTVNVGYTHDLVTGGSVLESDLTVSVTVDGALQTFGAAVSTDLDLGTFAVGTHVLRADVTDGSRVATVIETFTVAAPPQLVVDLLAPTAGPLYLFEDGVPLTWSVNVFGDVQAGTTYEWTVDGAEFGLWGDYDPAADTDASQAMVTLPAYDPIDAVWAEAAWATGVPHTVEFCASNGTGTEACVSFVVETAPTGTDVIGPYSVNGITEVWSGLRRVLGTVTIENGGILIINPGTQVIMGGPASSAQFHVADGELRIGALGQQRVVVRRQGSGTAQQIWAAPNIGATTRIVLESTDILGAGQGVLIDGQFSGAPVDSIELRDVHFENGTTGVSGGCVSVGENLSFKDIGTALDEGFGYGCGVAPSAYPNLTVENATQGLRIATSAALDRTLVVDNATFRNIAGSAIAENTAGTNQMMDVTVSNSLFDDVDGAALNLNGQADDSNYQIFGNTFRHSGGTGTGISAGTVAIDTLYAIQGNVFDGLDIGINVLSQYSDIEVHLNTFRDIGTWAFTGGGFQNRYSELGGNWYDSGAQVIPLTPAGTWLEVPTVLSSYSPRLGNPLNADFATVDLRPDAYIVQPDRNRRYNHRVCVPLVASSPFNDIDVGASCTWHIDGAEVFADVDGCLDTQQSPLSNGNHNVELRCNGVPVHSAPFYADDESVMAEIHRANTVWNGNIHVVGDVIVPAGKTLTLEPGTQVLVAAADAWRYQEASNTGIGYGGTDLDVTLRVYGTLNVEGTAMEPVFFGADSMVAAADQWRGFGVREGGYLSVDHALIQGTQNTFDGQHVFATVHAQLPRIFLRDVVVDHALGLFEHVVASEMTRVTTTNVQQLSWSLTQLANDLVIDNCDLNFGVTGFDLGYTNLPGGPAAYTLDVVNSNFTRTTNDRVGSAFWLRNAVTTLRILDGGSPSTFSNLDTLARMGADPGATVFIDNASVTNVQDLLWAEAAVDGLNINNMRFESGRGVWSGANFSGPNNAVVTDSHFIDVTYPFEFTDIYTQSLNVTGSQFDGATRVLGLATGNPATTYVLSGNNFVNISGLGSVVDRGDNYGGGSQSIDATFAASVDLTNNWFGTADTVQIELLIDDERTDSGPGDVKGQTDYTGYAAAPLTLAIP